jgi:copper chaperone CopZ
LPIAGPSSSSLLLPIAGPSPAAAAGAGALTNHVEVSSNGLTTVSAGQIGLIVDTTSTGHIVHGKFAVGGMTCASCVAAIEGELRHRLGVKSVSVGLIAEKADVEWDDAICKAEDIAEAIRGVGYDATFEAEVCFFTNL